MARQKSYDVFISYRHDGGLDFARSIATQLRSEGYQCFFDQRELKTGLFNRQIYEAIEHSKYFIIVLTPNALERCSNPEDWVRAEIGHARKMGIPVVPVAVRGEKLTFPDSLPESLAWLKSAQASFIDRETDFEDTIAKMLRNQLPRLCGMTTAQHRRAKRQAENVFLRRAARFKDNDGVVNEEERAELEQLASASGISRIRLEELIEKVETAAAKRAKTRAWMKNHAGIMALLGGAIIALLAWAVVRTSPETSPKENPESAKMENIVQEAQALSLKESAFTEKCGKDSPLGQAAIPPKEKPESAKTVGEKAAASSQKTDKAAVGNQTAATRLAKLSARSREYAEADFKKSLARWRDPVPNEITDPIAAQIIREYEKAAAEGRKLHRLGMRPKELMDTRPDLVLKFADLRSRVKNELRQLIKDNKQEEALRYYNSAKRTFAALEMCPLSRPSFSK